LNIFILEAPTEPWKIFIQSREQFTCSGERKNSFLGVFKYSVSFLYE
jgi:hypothetical protein